MEPRISIITLGVKDLARAIRFYRDGLGLTTKAAEKDPIAFFETSGTRLALYPLNELKDDISSELNPLGTGFNGITLAHNVRRKEQVAQVLALAERAGGKIVKEAQDVFWGGHSGYFTDLDGYFWEVAWAECWKFNSDGSLVL
jgi:uncharacterized glyoxalase superfamily protein PhnB